MREIRDSMGRRRMIKITSHISSYFRNHQCRRKQFDVDDSQEHYRIGFKCIGCGTRWYSPLRDFKRFGFYQIPNEMGRTIKSRKSWVEGFNGYPEIRTIRG